MLTNAHNTHETPVNPLLKKKHKMYDAFSISPHAKMTVRHLEIVMCDDFTVRKQNPFQ